MHAARLIKYIDSILGKLGTYVLSQAPNRAISQRSIDRILIIRPGGIGDAVLLIPSIHAISKIFPSAAIEVLAEKRNAGIFGMCSAINKILLYDRPTDLINVLRSNYDIIIDSEQFHRLSAVVARLADARISIGFATNEREKLFTHSIAYSHNEYEAYSFLNLLKPITEAAVDDLETSYLSAPSAAFEKIRHLLLPLSNNRIITIFPGGSIQERKWGSTRFHQTAKLLSEQGYGTLVVGGKEDVQAGEEIINGLANSLSLCGQLALPETAAALHKSALLITGDSGIMHIGAGLGLKIVSLFGPGREKKWAPQGKNCIVINKHLSCSPCTTFGYTPKCKRNAECMKQITVEEVFAAAMTLLEK